MCTVCSCFAWRAGGGPGPLRFRGSLLSSFVGIGRLSLGIRSLLIGREGPGSGELEGFDQKKKRKHPNEGHWDKDFTFCF